MVNKNGKIVVFGSKGLIGGEIYKQLIKHKYSAVIECSHNDLELTDQSAVNDYFKKIKPDYIIFCAVQSVTDFESQELNDARELYANIIMQCNVLEAAKNYNVKRGVFLGSAMLYPWNNVHENEKLREEFLQEYDFREYRESMKATVLSKFVAMQMCQYYSMQYNCEYIYAIPTHIYGSIRNRKNLYFLEHLVMDICDAKLDGEKKLKLDVYGEGKAQKQFLHVSDCASAIIAAFEQYSNFREPINISTDEVESWSTIVEKICNIVGYSGEISFNNDRQENMMNRICSIEKLESIGWHPQISMYDGLTQLCNEYLEQRNIYEK